MTRSLFAGLLLLLLVAAAVPMHAQTTATLWLSSEHNGGGGRFPSSRPNSTVNFDDGSGYGAGVERMFGAHLSGELAVFRVTSSAELRDGNTPFVSLGDVELTPITAMLRYHFRPRSAFDVYVGGGAAYVRTADLDSADLRADGLAPLHLDEETTSVIGGGVLWTFSPRWGAAIDARYLPLKLHARAIGTSAAASIDPLIVSAGLRIRF
jgi:outer membrane protein W